MSQLLSKVPETRLGGSFAALKSHPWFDNFDWDKLYYQELPPPYKPPKNKVLTNEQVGFEFEKKRPIIEEIKNDEKASKYINQKIPKPKNPKWEDYF